MPRVTAEEQESNIRVAAVRKAVTDVLCTVQERHPELTFEETLEALMLVAARHVQHLRNGQATPIGEGP